MPVKTLKDFLDRSHVKYVSIAHSRAYTAQEIAASTHIPGKELAKTVIVKLDGRLAMVVVPASHRVDFQSLKKVTGAKSAELAREDEFETRFPGCETGAMPPFGNLFDMEVVASETLTQDEEIAFNAGSHVELIKLAYADFERLVAPKVASVSTKGD